MTAPHGCYNSSIRYWHAAPRLVGRAVAGLRHFPDCVYLCSISIGSEDTPAHIREQIRALVARCHHVAFQTDEFQPKVSALPVPGKVFDEHEVQSLTDSAFDFWLTTGRFIEEFERQFAKITGIRHTMLRNSGSSANMLSLNPLTSPRLNVKLIGQPRHSSFFRSKNQHKVEYYRVDESFRS